MNEMRKLLESLEEVEHASKDRLKQEMTIEEILEIGKQYGHNKDGVMKAFILAHDAGKDFWEMRIEMRNDEGKPIGRYPNITSIPTFIKDPDTGEDVEADVDKMHIIYMTTPKEVHELFKWFDSYEEEFDRKKYFNMALDDNPFEGLEEEELNEISPKLARSYLKKTAPGSEDFNTIDAELEKGMLDPNYKMDPKLVRRKFGRMIGRMNAKDRKGFWGWVRKQAMKGKEKMDEGMFEEPTYDEFVESMRGSIIHKIMALDLFDEMLQAAGGPKELMVAVTDEAHSVADFYHGSGEGIGTSDMNAFVQNVGSNIGIDDVLGWNKPREGLEENAPIDDQYFQRGLPDEGDLVRIEGGEYDGKRGTVLDIDGSHDEEGYGVLTHTIKLQSGETVDVDVVETHYNDIYLIRVGEYEYDDEAEDKFAFSNPFEARMLELAGVPIKEAKGKLVKVPDELSDPDPNNPQATSDDAEKFIAALGPDDEVDSYVVDPETGEVLFEPFQTKRGVGMDQFKSARDRKDKMETWVPSIYGTDDIEDARDELGDLRYGNTSAAKFYNMVWRNLEDLLGSPEDLGSDVETWGELDYDTGIDVPVAIKRKDGKRLQEEDYDNFRELARLIKTATGNVSLSMMGTTDKGTVARFTPTLM